MKRSICFIILLAGAVHAFSQTATQFDYAGFEKQVLAYEPKKKEEIAADKFNYAVMILSETKKAVKGNINNFTVADYFNILSAFLSLKEAIPDIELAFEKFKQARGSCAYFMTFENMVNTNEKYAVIRDRFNEQLKKCRLENMDTRVNIKDYWQQNNLDSALVSLLYQINLNDQQFRQTNATDLVKQKPIDLANQYLIDSLFKRYKKYIGRSLAGDKFESTMWLVIQHADLVMMEKYLPAIQQAVSEKELLPAPLKMLIDRIYAIKYNYQIFGSQVNVKLADETIINKVRLQYHIE